MSKDINTKQEFLKALIKAQSEIGAVYKEKINPHFKSKYVPLNSILSEIKPILNDNGFFLTQKICNEGDQEILKTEITHINGESLNSSAPLNIADKTNPQKYGSAITYMRRYSLTSLLGLEEDDDDGDKASKTKIIPPIKKVSTQQAQQINDLLEEASLDKLDWCKCLKINSIADLPEDKFDNICNRLKATIEKNANN